MTGHKIPQTPSAEDWRHRAACREVDSELFFPIGTTGPAIPQIKAAKSVCRRCPVESECLTWALETRQRFGIWGGLTEQEREAILRRPKVPRPKYAVCGECGGPIGKGRFKYCSDACGDSARKRRDAARSHHADGVA